MSPFKHWAAAGALLVGIALGLTVGNPFPDITKKISKLGLQTAVVLLGFSLDLGTVARAGASGIGWALLSIGVTFALGLGISRWWSIRPSIGLLVTTGTAICGGSAIAAMSEATDAPKEDVAVALGTVFLLNAVALVAFPAVGHLLHMTPAQFGIWAGIGIHDVASVVGAATSYSPESLATATAVKLSRVLYLVPIVAFVSWRQRSKGKAPFPFFILFFILASAIGTFAHLDASILNIVRTLATIGFVLALLSIGVGVQRETLKRVGIRPLALGLLLWIVLSLLGFAAALQTAV